MNANAPKDEQIAAILTAKEWELSRHYFDGNVERMEKSWTITKRDVKAYIAEHGFPAGWVHFAPQTYDGVYVLPLDGGWSVRYQERGEVYEDERFPTQDEAMDYLLDTYYLSRRGIT